MLCDKTEQRAVQVAANVVNDHPLRWT